MKLKLPLYFAILLSIQLFAQDIAFNDVSLEDYNIPLASVDNKENDAVNLKERFEILQHNAEVSISYHTILEASLNNYIKNNKSDVANLIDKSKLYFPIFEKHLAAFNLPKEIKYLAVVESRLMPNAKSHMGAKGLWQFMPATGKAYGLKINAAIDERLDAIKATQAACKYLASLYKMFGDWNLVLAAYNAGPGNVRKAIRRSGGHNDFWKIRPYLPKETRKYVPSFYATYYMFEYADVHEIYPKDMDITFEDIRIIEVKNDITFKEIKERFNIDYKLLNMLNPQYKQGKITYSNTKKNYLILPSSVVRELVPCTSEIYLLAKEFAKKSSFFLGSVKNQEKNKCYNNKEVTTYTVKEGDSLWKIAMNFSDITINQLKSWNNLWSVSYLKPGTKLKILTN